MPKKPQLDTSRDVAAPEIKKLRADLAAAQSKLQGREDALALAKAEAEQNRTELRETKKRLVELDERVTTMTGELDNLRKQDSQVFRGISELRQRGQYSSALNAYRMFMQDFPASPLLPDAERAIAALTNRIQSGEFENSTTSSSSANSRNQESVKQRLPYGAVTAEELRPMIKSKTTREITQLLGNPDHVFPNGLDWGYADRAIEERTGQKDMLIITFSGDKVASFRVGYSGRKIIP